MNLSIKLLYYVYVTIPNFHHKKKNLKSEPVLVFGVIISKKRYPDYKVTFLQASVPVTLVYF